MDPLVRPAPDPTDPTDAADGADGADQVGLQLVRLRRTMEAFRARVLDASGHSLEGSGLAVLYHLTTSGPMRTSTLADRLGLDPSTTSRHVGGLERSGHVERVADPDDGRAWLVGATSAGTTAFQDTRALRNSLVGRVLQGWSREEVAGFAAALARFNDSVAGLAELPEHDTTARTGEDDR
ncbi:MarR family winged helix-turn-helix transcriptional regulator [Aquipuribacter sp. MA13-6]|uniref:MarR family winged helix-turn-helix transcriptional regulator n=1 Tax=unclassified Aquipuribacter TaxID=2635084 RepID=UPI003EE973BF